MGDERIGARPLGHHSDWSGPWSEVVAVTALSGATDRGQRSSEECSSSSPQSNKMKRERRDRVVVNAS